MAKDQLAEALGNDLDGGLDDQEAGSLDVDDNDEQEEVESTEGAEFVPPTKEQWDALQGKLSRARKQAQRLRESSKNGTVTPPEEAEKQKGELEKWQVRAVRSDAKAGLLERGADSELIELALSKLKVADISFDDDENADLEDWLDEMEEKYPKLFSKQAAPNTSTTNRTPRRPAAIDQGAAGNGKPAKATATFADTLLSSAYGPRGPRGRR